MSERVVCHNCFNHCMVAPTCRTCQGDGFLIKPVPTEVKGLSEASAVDALRVALQNCFTDYAEQAFQNHDFETFRIWTQAAEIAGSYVVKPVAVTIPLSPAEPVVVGFPV